MEQHARHTRRRQGRENTAKQRRHRHPKDICALLGRNLREDTNLDTQGTNIAEPLS